MRCRGCAASYEEIDGIVDLRLPGDARTERVRSFYSEAPFPGYPPRDSIDWLRARAERSRFAQMLTAAIPYDARIVEVGSSSPRTSAARRWSWAQRQRGGWGRIASISSKPMCIIPVCARVLSTSSIVRAYSITRPIRAQPLPMWRGSPGPAA
jgi:hypothetical protein